MAAEEGAIRYHEDRIAQLQKDLAGRPIRESEEVPHGTPRNPAPDEKDGELETRLEVGPWKEAASKKCDYWRDAPPDLVDQVRKMKGGVKGKDHHFTASGTEPVLFRFRRGQKQ